MLKFGLNRNGINKVSNRIFNTLNHFFLGSGQYPIYDDLSFQPEQSSAYCQEWDLHQDVSDILIKDIKVSVSWILPSVFLETLNKLNKHIMVYFYADVIDEETGYKPDLQKPLSSSYTSIKAKIIYVSGHARKSLNTGIISFHHGWKNFVRKLEILLKLKQEEETYYLIGTFTPNHYIDQACNLSNIIRDRDQMYLRPSFPFHKRN